MKANRSKQSCVTKKIIRNCKKMIDCGATYKEVTKDLEKMFINDFGMVDRIQYEKALLSIRNYTKDV